MRLTGWVGAAGTGLLETKTDKHYQHDKRDLLIIDRLHQLLEFISAALLSDGNPTSLQ
jgi:hypothetical protein